jgi:16S rRNA (cytidine1402-2'-O)-methyltransferase
MPATLFVVATPIGNLEDITLRALRVLREVSLIAAEDTRRTAHLLARYAISTPTTSLHEHNEAEKSPALVERLRRGESIALVSDAGTPTLSDPGRRLIQAAIDAAIRVEPIPGPSAALTVLMASGLPADSFRFLGFPPTRPADRRRWLDRLGEGSDTVVFYEAPHRIRRTLADVQTRTGDVLVVVGRELTKAHEELVRGPISAVLDSIQVPRGEFAVAIHLGEKPKSVADAVGQDVLADEFGQLTKIEGLTRRAAISALARKYSRSARDIYAAIEKAKTSAD